MKYKQSRKYSKPLQYKKDMAAILRWLELGCNTRKELLERTHLKHGRFSNAIQKLVNTDVISREFILGKMRFVRYHINEVVE